MKKDEMSLLEQFERINIECNSLVNDCFSTIGLAPMADFGNLVKEKENK